MNRHDIEIPCRDRGKDPGKADSGKSCREPAFFQVSLSAPLPGGGRGERYALCGKTQNIPGGKGACEYGFIYSGDCS